MLSLKDSAAGQLYIVQLDVADEALIKAAAETASVILGGRGLDYLLNNAAIVSECRGYYYH